MDRGTTTAWEIGLEDFSVSCLLDEHAVYERRVRIDHDAKPDSPIFSGDKATFDLANLDCTVYDKHAVRPVERAFTTLERTI